MGSIPYDIEIKLGSDEASCSQVASFMVRLEIPWTGVKFLILLLAVGVILS